MPEIHASSLSSGVDDISDRLFHPSRYPDEEIKYVGMGEIDFVRFSDRKSCGIGTRGLNGCIVVCIINRLAAILAHVNPGSTELIDQQLISIKNLYYASGFDPKDHGCSLLVCPVADVFFKLELTKELREASEAAGKYVSDWLRQNIATLKTMPPSTYDPDQPAEKGEHQRGSVYIRGDTHGHVHVYVNDEMRASLSSISLEKK